MSYKSSAFEAQLAKHKNAKIVKDVADLPDGRHRPQTRVNVDSGRITPNQDMYAESLQALRDNKLNIPPELLMQPNKKRIKTSHLALLFMIGCLAVAGIKQRDRVQAFVVHLASSGGDAAVRVQTIDPAAAMSSMGVGEGDLGKALQEAQAKAKVLASQGPAQSMQYIQEETKRLQDMAKTIGTQSGVVPASPMAAPAAAQPAQ